VGLSPTGVPRRKGARCVAKTILLAKLNGPPTSSVKLFSFQSEEFTDELDLPKDIAFRQPPHLAFLDHV
jgi:hypothetical protein